jgi:hypothetical protein
VTHPFDGGISSGAHVDLMSVHFFPGSLGQVGAAACVPKGIYFTAAAAAAPFTKTEWENQTKREGEKAPQ